LFDNWTGSEPFHNHSFASRIIASKENGVSGRLAGDCSARGDSAFVGVFTLDELAVRQRPTTTVFEEVRQIKLSIAFNTTIE
jgi:hypothetical protein